MRDRPRLDLLDCSSISMLLCNVLMCRDLGLRRGRWNCYPFPTHSSDQRSCGCCCCCCPGRIEHCFAVFRHVHPRRSFGFRGPRRAGLHLQFLARGMDPCSRDGWCQSIEENFVRTYAVVVDKRSSSICNVLFSVKRHTLRPSCPSAAR